MPRTFLLMCALVACLLLVTAAHGAGKDPQTRLQMFQKQLKDAQEELDRLLKEQKDLQNGANKPAAKPADTEEVTRATQEVENAKKAYEDKRRAIADQAMTTDEYKAAAKEAAAAQANYDKLKADSNAKPADVAEAMRLSLTASGKANKLIDAAIDADPDAKQTMENFALARAKLNTAKRHAVADAVQNSPAARLKDLDRLIENKQTAVESYQKKIATLENQLKAGGNQAKQKKK
ncbi:MAG: hypothetical protein GC162_11825 [Planctomycetes bacterium]|nr:hypothetical protein [Planctomycetota bacterium]